jgi:hypothetical protein
VGSSSTSGVTYSWSGPDGFSSRDRKVAIYIAGNYSLTVTSEDGLYTSTAAIEVNQDTVQPLAIAKVSGVINCSNLNTTLHAITSTQGATFAWINSTTTFRSTLQDPVISDGGTYHLIVTNPVNGCASTAGIVVTKDIASPGVSNLTPGVLSCATSQVTINISSPTSRVKYNWTGPGGFSSSLEDPIVTAPGVYKITVTDSVNTCKSIKNITVNGDYTGPGASISASGAGILTCANTSTTLSANANIVNVTYSWTGPNGFSSAVQNPFTSVPGDYILQNTSGINGCISKDTFTVTQNIVKPGVSVNTSGQLNCINATVNLLGSSPTSGVAYKWVGPAGFGTQFTQNPGTSFVGVYVLTVENPINGCSSETSTEVVQNMTPPASVTAGNNGPFTCSASNITLTGNSSTSGVSYKWSGPSGFTSSIKAPSTNIAGSYTLTVTDLANGCTGTAVTTIGQNLSAPASVTANNNGPLTCTISSVSLTGNSSTSNVKYTWSGPAGFSSALQSPTATLKGTYTLTVTDLTNNCSTVTNTIVAKDTILPASVTASNSGPLTCTTLSTSLLGNTSTAGVSYTWTGPGSFSSASQNATVSAPGRYYLTVRNVTNNCKDTTSTLVGQDKTIPANVTAGNNGPITCLTSSAKLSGNSSTPGVTYKWTGSGYSSTEQNPSITSPGTYALQVKNPVNGCTKNTYTVVIQNVALPSAVNANNNGPLTCVTSGVTLTGSSLTSGVTYKWSGPANFSSNTAIANTSSAGTYTLTVTDPVNGCAVAASTIVGQNVDLPAGVTAENNGPLTCATTSVTLTGNAVTSGVTYSWSGPNGFTSSLRAPVINKNGTYLLTVTNPVNNCTVTVSTLVDQDITKPGSVKAVNDGPLTCATTNVALAGSSSTPGVTYHWSGPGNFSSESRTPQVGLLGIYKVLIINPANGCKDSTVTTVAQNIAVPGVTSSVAGVFTCSMKTITLGATSPTSGVTYSWTGPNGFMATTQYPQISVSGKYKVTATNPVNGCISKDSITTRENIAAPGVDATVFDKLTCGKTLIHLSAASTTSGVTYSWSGPQNFNSTEQYPLVALAGKYTVTATNPVNGCASTDDITVAIDTIKPANVLATSSNIITCSVTDATIDVATSASDVSYVWSGPDNFVSTDKETVVSDAGLYYVTVTNYLNSCFTVASVNVEENTIKPQGVTATSSGNITCTASSITLTGASTTQSATYKWSGPNFGSTLPIVTVSNTGTYSLTVTNTENGCEVIKLVPVALDNVKPTGITTSVSGILTCNLTSVNVSASSTTSTVAYSWSGPGSFTSTLQSPLVQTAGTYNVTITNTVNGCFETRSIPVVQNNALPLGISASVSGVITCSNPSRNLSGASTTTGATYHWTGPSGFNSALASPLVTVPGDYTLVVTNPTSGCTETRIVPVTHDVVPPSDVDATISSSLNCSHTSVTIAGYTSTGTVGYNWIGPNSFTSSTQSAIITHSGTYKLTVTNTGNGCTATDSVIVSENIQAPDISAQGATITCSNLVVNINANSLTPGATYLWSTNVALSDRTLKNPSVSQPGDYTVTVTNPANGCTNTATATVGLNNATPDLSVSASGTGILTCSNLSETLTASSTTAGAILSWTGFSGQNPVIVNHPATYTASSLNPANGCSISKDIIVTQDVVKPNLLISSSGTLLTCNSPSVTLTSSTTTSGTILTWTGFATGINPVTINNAGVYYATARTTSNGCTRVDSVVVKQNNQKPDLVAQGGTITCTEQLITITASSTKPVTYLWSDNVILSDPTEQDALVFEGGEYSVTVTSTENGCTNSTTVTVALDNMPPVCNISSSDSPTASKDHTLNAQSVTGGTYTWSKASSDPGWSIVSGANTANLVYHAGNVGTSATFTLTVTSPNGCDPGICQIVVTAISSAKNALAGSSGNDNDFQVNVYPNPFSDKAFIEFTAAASGKVIIEMYSANGNSLGTLFNNNVEASQQYKVDVDAGGKPSGTYYLIIKTNSKVYRQKLVLIK